ncbi:hypothetical protein QQF64_028743 [Cirrhinus molitorella]|uniref:Uncharacterized protein n=1 Tax=Cirrhinus molitorella TaxID=172907 RepID=A0ABR3N7T2_9TELE
MLIMQKLEETLLNPDSSTEEKAYTLRGDEESNVTPVPARIREIITRNLADTPTGRLLYSLNELTMALLRREQRGGGEPAAEGSAFSDVHRQRPAAQQAGCSH